MNRVLKSGTYRITQPYSSSHRGVDLGKGLLTETVIAHSGGTVVTARTGQKNNKTAVGTASYGNYVRIDHGGGYSTLYAHLGTVYVKKGQRVARGEPLGTMGNTGRSFGTHLHFEVRRDNERLDPTDHLVDDLPVATPVSVRYRAHVGGKWLPWVTDAGDGPDGYAGIYGRPLTAVQIRPQHGVVRYRVMQQGAWLPWVTSKKSHAGVRGVPIDAIEVVGEGVTPHLTTHRLGGYLDGIQLTLTQP